MPMRKLRDCTLRLRSPITNFMIDTQLLQKRSTALKSRLGEVGSSAELGRRE